MANDTPSSSHLSSTTLSLQYPNTIWSVPEPSGKHILPPSISEPVPRVTYWSVSGQKYSVSQNKLKFVRKHHNLTFDHKPKTVSSDSIVFFRPWETKSSVPKETLFSHREIQATSALSALQTSGKKSWVGRPPSCHLQEARTRLQEGVGGVSTV